MREPVHAQPLGGLPHEPVTLARPKPGTPSKGRPAAKVSSPPGEGAEGDTGGHPCQANSLHSAVRLSTVAWGGVSSCGQGWLALLIHTACMPAFSAPCASSVASSPTCSTSWGSTSTAVAAA